MKSRIEGVTLTINTKKNSLPIEKRIFGCLKLSKDLDAADFNEEELYILGTRKRIMLYHKRGYNVTFNTETDKYRISVIIDANTEDWSLDAEEGFCECMNYLARRTNA